MVKVEQGDPGVALGVAFELASLTGTTLFQPFETASHWISTERARVAPSCRNAL